MKQDDTPLRSMPLLCGVDLAADGTQSESYISFPLGYLLEHVNDWDSFCADIGLNPWVLNEGLALSSDTHPVSVAMLKKHGVLAT